ncbi:MAG: diadenylate cyclase [Nanoarchaeota archaeon]|nr:diadenylate cyclase [Nanoarchaeota archaeon]
MVQQFVQRRALNSSGNDSLTRWTAAEHERDVRQQVDKLIESAKEELTKQESSSGKFSIVQEVSGPVNSLSGIAGSALSKQDVLYSQPDQLIRNNQVNQNSQNNKTTISASVSITKPAAPAARPLPPRKQIEEVIGMAAAKIARDIDANCVISIERKGIEMEDKDHLNVQISIFRKLDVTKFEKVEYLTKMRKVLNGSVVPIKELLMEAIMRKYIDKGDRIVCVEDESVGMGYKGLLFIFDVDKIFFNISMLNITGGDINPDVVESVINIALEIHKEGREGKKIGTAFIIGRPEEFKPYINQMILNPFQSYPEAQRKITDPNMKETIKNFAMLDGVFVIDTTGTIMNAGAYINVDATCIELPGGYGTRHRNSSAITKITDSIAVVVSESGGMISVFKGGKLVTKLP